MDLTRKYPEYPGEPTNSRLEAGTSSRTGSWGESEPAATNAPVGRSVHWMGCDFHSVPDGVHRSPFPFVFAADHCTFSFFGLILIVFFLDLTSHIPTLLTFLPS
jgi:hypothetical protein